MLGPKTALLVLHLGASARLESVGVLGMGSPDLPACGAQHGSTNGLVRPIFISKHSRPSRGAKPREAGDTKASLGAASLG